MLEMSNSSNSVEKFSYQWNWSLMRIMKLQQQKTVGLQRNVLMLVALS